MQIKKKQNRARESMLNIFLCWLVQHLGKTRAFKALLVCILKVLYRENFYLSVFLQRDRHSSLSKDFTVSLHTR